MADDGKAAVSPDACMTCGYVGGGGKVRDSLLNLYPCPTCNGPRERLLEMMPEQLRDAYDQDSIIEACFATAAYGGLSRESALIQCVLQYRKQIASLRDEWRKQTEQRGIPPLIKLEARQVVHLRPDTLAKLRRFAAEWTDQEGCGSAVLDDLADAARRDLEPPRYVALLRRFVREWRDLCRADGLTQLTPDASRVDLILLLEVADAFEEEDRHG